MNWNTIKYFPLLITLFAGSLSYAETVWIDVRSKMEHSLDNIEGDIRISHDEIVENVENRFPDKNTEIRLYCKSGGRASRAISALKTVGYKNVSNAGGIQDARKERGLGD